MNWEDAWKIVLCAIASAGGIGGIIIAVIKFSSNMIADRLSQKFEAKLQKEMEQYRANLDGRIHITKAQYDAEFEIYRALSKAFFELIVKLNTIFSPQYRPIDENYARNTKKEYDKYCNVLEKAQNVQNLLYENGAFIPEYLYNKYDALFDDTSAIFWEYSDLLQKTNPGDIVFDYEWLEARHIKLKEIRNSFISLNSDLRAYLQELTVVE